MSDSEFCKKLLRTRRSIFPNAYLKKEIETPVLMEILENANWAPTHRLTEPWRFKVFQGQSLAKLSQFLGDFYTKNTPAELFSQHKYEKTIEKPLQSACVIAICMQRDAAASIPEWEEIAAVACAVQNMWLTCTAHQIGAYWSSPKAILEANDFLQLVEGERCLGLFYMGYCENMGHYEGKRRAVSEKITWVK